MKSKIKEVVDTIEERALEYTKHKGGYSALVSRVIQIGGNSVMSRKFTPENAVDVAAMMIAALALMMKEKD